MIDEVSGYWSSYGGKRAFFQSPVLWIAAIIAVMLLPLWRSGQWADLAISILPNLLGLSIGAMAILLAFPTTRMFRILAEDGRKDSFYLDLASRLTHFIIVQAIALILGLFGKSYHFYPLSFIGCWALVYAVLTAAVIALELFGVAQIYNHPGAQDDEKGR
jgi:phosphate starvation-inducible membrane PsiE